MLQLRQQCKDRGLKGVSTLKKAELLNILSSDTSIDADFVLQPMITYIGNKRKLIPWITDVVKEIHSEIGKLKVFDGFAGSGVVSRALMPFCYELHSNDMEYYSYILLRCFLETPTSEQKERIDRHFDEMKLTPELGFISKLYSPICTDSPSANERCFYTRENAMIIDGALTYIKTVEPDIKHYILGPLLIKASINVNTAGVFRGFYKKDGIGHFGGAGENALERILAPIQLVKPVWSKSPCRSICYHSDINELILTLNGFDLIYLDPPYNEHPYGSNYFMLNVIANGEEPVNCSKVSGIPKQWNKSVFNGRKSAFDSMLILLRNCLEKARYVLISYNNEGLVTDWTGIFETLQCNVKKYEKEYDVYHGSRNLAGRNNKVVEIMYLLNKI